MTERADYSSVQTDLQRLASALEGLTTCPEPGSAANLAKRPELQTGQLGVWTESGGQDYAALQLDVKPRRRARWAAAIENA